MKKLFSFYHTDPIKYSSENYSLRYLTVTSVIFQAGAPEGRQQKPYGAVVKDQAGAP